MSDTSGSISYLVKMAARCRRAAADLRGDDQSYLIDLAERCEKRIAEYRRAEELVATED